jgi:hypothetical protein
VERIRHLCRVEEEEEAGKDGQGPKACMDMTICSNSGDVYQGDFWLILGEVHLGDIHY